MNPGDLFNPRNRFVGLWLPDTLVKYTGLSHGAKLLYARLCWFINDRTGECDPDTDTLAAGIGVSKRQVITYLAELAREGFILTRRRGLGMTNTYGFLWHPIFDDNPVRKGVGAEVQKAAFLERKQAALPQVQGVARQEVKGYSRQEVKEPAHDKEVRIKPLEGGGRGEGGGGQHHHGLERLMGLFREVTGKELVGDDRQRMEEAVGRESVEVVEAAMYLTAIRATLAGTRPASFRYFLPEIPNAAKGLKGIAEPGVYNKYLAAKWEAIRNPGRRGREERAIANDTEQE